MEVLLFGGLSLASVIGLALSAFWIWRSGKRAAWRRFTQEGPRCPACGYSLKGLHEAKCPECGSSYTLDELWKAQRDIKTDFIDED